MLKSNLIDDKIIIEGFDFNLLGVISHDLTIREIISPLNKEKNEATYDLKPSETIFISCNQVINLPSNLIALVHGKNSRIRQGIDLVSPIYQPGHKTRIFFRITNISSDVITLNKNDKIAQISFEETQGDKTSIYKGEFQNEFSYKGLGKYDREYISKKINSEIMKLEDIEKKIYCGVATIITILIAIFGFFNTGLKIEGFYNIPAVFMFLTLSIIILVTSLFSIVGFLFTKRKKISFSLGIISFVCFLMLLYFVYN